MSIVRFASEKRRWLFAKSARKLNQAVRSTRPIAEELERRYLLSAPPLPVITGSDYLITAAPYNAVGDGATNNTTAIQDAITAASQAGGGTVEVPAAAGAFECGEIYMASNVNLQIDSGAELQAVSGLSASVWINVDNCNNWEITGLGTGASMGTLDGHNGGAAGSLNMVQLAGATIGLIQNVKVDNSPHEHINCGGSAFNNNVTINGVSISTASTIANTDGIDPAGENWLIENCTISDGDDDIAIKPQNQYCANIDIESCTIESGHGISIGGETNDGLNGLIVNNITFNGTVNGLRLKADRGNGGLVENCTYSNITMNGVEYPILIDSYYNQSNDFPTNPYSDTGLPVNATTPIWQNISFSNITSTNAPENGVSAAIYGLPEAPITDLSFRDVHITAPTGMQIDHVRDMSFDTDSYITVSNGGDLIGNTSGNYPTPVDATIVEAGYTNTDIDAPTVPFDTTESLFDPDTLKWTILGGGSGITGTYDQFNYSYQGPVGNGSITAELTSLTGTAGVMYRASTNSYDPFAAVVQTSSQIIFEYRTTTSGSIESDAVSGAVGSTYLRVTDSDGTFSGYYSTNGGSTYTQIGSSVDISAMPPAGNVGLAATDNTNGDLGSAVFAHVTLTDTLTLTTPTSGSSVNEGGSYTVDWVGGSSTDTVQLWVEGGPTNSWTELTAGVPQTAGSYTWNTTGVDHGWYYFQAWDIPASGTSYAVQSPDYLHIEDSGAAAPNISLSNPPESTASVLQGNNYTINFVGSDGTGDSNPIYVQLWVYSGNTGLWTELPNANYLPASQGSYVWNTTGMLPGWYSFAAHATDGDLWSYTASPGWLNITVPTPTINFLTPTSSQSVAAGGSFNLNWNITGLSTSDASTATVQIWAQYLSNGSPVWQEITASVSASGGTYTWTVPTSPGGGTYYAFSIWLNDGDEWWAQASPNWLQVT
ncbi:MAG: glycosyl hydrolase family 28 protein [Tepidisphaeraceae bacterium]|jgi:hypothetical protein